MRTPLISTVLFVFSLFSFPCRGEQSKVPSSAVPDGDQLIQNNTAFGLTLYKEMAQTKGNIVLSPLSVSIATAMLAAGAEGATLAELAAAARLELPQETLHPQLSTLLRGLQQGAGSSAKLKFANGIWVHDRCQPSPSYQRVLLESYGAIPEALRFGEEPGEASRRINRFVSENTQGKIPSIVSPEMFDAWTQAVLVNTVYFLAAWDHMFAEQRTEREPFHLAGGQGVSTNMMHSEGTRRYYKDGEVAVLELPYQMSGLSMLLVLPDPSQSLESLEAKLTPSMFAAWRQGLALEQVDVAVPRFEVSHEVDLIPILRRLGVSRAFAQGAEFTELCGDSNAFVNRGIHRAVLGITEKGTEAAAATLYQMTLGAQAYRETTTTFRADRPFLFFVQEKSRGTILFMGRLANPEAKGL